MSFQPNYLTTLNGSVPYLDTADACQRVASAVDIPAWPQMVKRDFRENMYAQYAAVLPSIVIDDGAQKITFDTSGDITPQLETFYMPYLEDDVDYYRLPPDHASGFFAMDSLLASHPGAWVKGQVTGPISMGLTITDQDLRASLYNDILADTLVKNAAMNARWQIRQLKASRSNIIIFVDEPYMASFGSAYINLSRDQVVAMLDDVFAAIHAEGGLAGVHCCANTDWSVLLDTRVDILNLDAYGYIENLALYPAELRGFLDRGGVIAWGIVPNTQEINTVTPDGLVVRLLEGIALICQKAVARGVTISPGEFDSRSLITPTCGLGPTTPEISDKVLLMLAQMGEIMRKNPRN